MSASPNRKIAIICGLVLVGLAFFALIHHSGHAQADASLGLQGSPAPHSAAAQTALSTRSNDPSQVSPFIVADTATDSPGTNLETRVVTFSAEIGGTPPIVLQWKVDKGGGFVAVSASATNSVFTISNAQIADTGLYALFATNCAGSIKTTPVTLVVIAGLD